MAGRGPETVGDAGLSASAAHAPGPVRVAARVTGTVQGVGFRPYAYRLARSLGLAGFVRNDADAVAIEIEGDPGAVEEMLARLAAEAPAPARVESVVSGPVAARGEDRFRIRGSRPVGGPSAPVPADVATCDACLAELRDPADRRYRYPFVNCTACGPRFTIVRSLPYDRANTTMSGFGMCDACRAEYEDPADRRFHAEPNACPACGPRARLLDRDGTGLRPDDRLDAVAAAAALLRAGAIVAIKGVGGWHLACRADDGEAVAELRRRKRRDTKPFALLVADVDAARALVEADAGTARALAGPERPIVLAPRRPEAAVAAAVAPGCGDLGVMLPHSPLHHLLIADAGGALVMTSGNVASEPIAHEDDDALARLGPIADALLAHDRPIRAPAEDPVVRVTGAAPPLMIRRSRGYVPAPVPLAPPAARPLLGVGAELKSCCSLAAGERAWPGPQAGDLDGLASRRRFEAGIAHLERLCRIEPEIVAHDLHPDYASTRWALERGDLEPVAVQHHHAHLAACLAEHGHAGPAVAAIFDGAGLGTDGTVWGGEILVGDARSFTRAGAILGVPLPGGDAAAREPWRMACSWLAAASGESVPARPAPLAASVTDAGWEAIARLAAAAATPRTTSAGRLFDAVAALAGFAPRVGHEGQAAMELEAAARDDERDAYPIAVETGGAGGPGLVIDPRAAILAVGADVDSGLDPGAVAARFHNGLAAATSAAIAAAAEAAGVGTAVLSGGAFQNRLLLERTGDRLRASGLRVLVPQRLPPNDGGIAYGQVAVAAAGLS
ncbi:MAG: carbamoyltransferase HypF [Acidobacteria bacterium]|nr:MAG: carbamoyltransferase HypF [Acidobacteriota bacterium]